MAFEIKVPTLGESIVEATVGSWLKQVGDPIAAGDVVVELETDKVNVEVRSDAAGVLERIDRGPGVNVAVGEVLGAIGAGGTVAASAEQQSATPAASNGSPASEPAAETRGNAATPVARRIAEANNIDVAAVAGSGPGGRVTKEDVAAQIAPATATAEAPAAVATAPPAQAPAAPPAASRPTAPISAPPAVAEAGREVRVRMSRRRQTIARRLVEAQRTAAMLTTFNEVDMSAIMEVRKRRGQGFQERHNVKLGFMSFFVKAVIGALKFQPRLNAEIQGDEIVLKQYYDIGIAVSADEGLVVPVLRGADRMSFADIERGIGELGKRARENALTLEDLQGGSFTITNGGIFGSLMSTPILNAPQVGILGMHGIKERPIAVNGEIVIRPMMYIALSYDHRIVDGAEAVRFLVRVKELVEDPESLLLDG